MSDPITDLARRTADALDGDLPVGVLTTTGWRVETTPDSAGFVLATYAGNGVCVSGYAAEFAEAPPDLSDWPTLGAIEGRVCDLYPGAVQVRFQSGLEMVTGEIRAHWSVCDQLGNRIEGGWEMIPVDMPVRSWALVCALEAAKGE